MPKILFKKGHKINKGRIMSLEERRLRSESAKKFGVGKWRKGMRMSQETKKKLSNTKKGNKSVNWKGGVTPIYKTIRKSLEYKIWRTAVFERDNYICIWCKQKGGVLHADHIKPFAYYPELRFAIDNGRTLCIECHKKTDTYGSKAIKNH